MASNGIPVNIPATRLVQGSRARTSESDPTSNGKKLPPGSETAPASAVAQTVQDAQAATTAEPGQVPRTAKPRQVAHPETAESQPKKPDLPALVAHLNKHLNTSGRPDQFRLDASSGRNLIQQINPDTGEVIAELPESMFPTLAQGLRGPGLLIDTKA